MSDAPIELGATCVLYARVSTDDKDQDPQTQVRNIRRYCDANGITIMEEYVEELSAKDTNRPMLRAALGHIALDHPTYLIAWSQSRLSRDTHDMDDILRICTANGTAIRFVSSADMRPETDEGELINYISTWQGMSERRKLAMNTKAGMETARLKGIHCGRMLAFCFSHRVTENANRIQTDGEHKTYIASIETVLDFARQGLSVPYVAKNIMGISPNTLRTALQQEGVYDDYQRMVEIARGTAQKGADATTGAKPADNRAERGGA